MTEKELDALLCERLRTCVSRRNLPDDFAGRLKASVRRSKRLLRLRLTCVVVLAVVLCVMLGGVMRSSARSAPAECALIAERDTPPTEKVTGWMLLGFFRDRFKRNRNGKRKDKVK